MCPKLSFPFLVLCLFLPLFWQCQDTPATSDEPKFFARFSVRYLAEDKQLRGQAELFTGDSISNVTPLTFPAGVAFLGSGTQEKKLPGSTVRYESTMRVSYLSPTYFSFQLPNTAALTKVPLAMEGLDNFELMQTSKSRGLRLQVKGGLEAGESLLLLFTDPQQEARTIVRPGPLNDDGLLFIPPDALLHFEPGAYRVYLVKSKETEALVDKMSYTALIEYYTQEQAFELVE